MNAKGLAAFEIASQRAMERIYPGQVRFGGVTYDVALTYGPIEVRLADNEGGGSYYEQGMFFDLAKSRLPTAPANGTVVEVTSSEEFWIVESVDGRNDQDRAWLVRCIKHPE